MWRTLRSVVASSTPLGAVAQSRLSALCEISTGLCTLSAAGRSVTPSEENYAYLHNLSVIKSRD